MYLSTRTSHISMVLRFTVVSVPLIVIATMKDGNIYLCLELYCEEQ